MKLKSISIAFAIAIVLISCSDDKSKVTNTDNLKTVYKNDFLIGTTINEYLLDGKDKKTLDIILNEFNSLTPENFTKWEKIHPEPNLYNFNPSDKFVEFGNKNNIHLVGHTLVWHSQTPGWVFENEDGEPKTRDELIALMKSHIDTVVGRYKGKIQAWDVVNEAFNDDGSLRKSKWLNIIGDDYIKLAFKFAREADPNAELYYNDYNMYKPAKRKSIVEYFNKMKSDGVKIDGIGLQAHWFIGDPSTEVIEATIDDYKALGVKIMLTEVDLSVLPNPYNFSGADISTRFELTPEMNPYPNSLPDSVAIKQANIYAEIFQILIKNRDIIGRVTFWGTLDGSSWKNNFPIRGRTDYPLLFDREGKKKPAYELLIKLKTK